MHRGCRRLCRFCLKDALSPVGAGNPQDPLADRLRKGNLRSLRSKEALGSIYQSHGSYAVPGIQAATLIRILDPVGGK